MIKRLTLLTAASLLAPFTQAMAAPDMDFTVTASEAVNVDTSGGTPRLALDIGGVTRYATYASGSGTDTLTFSYTTQAGDLDLDGISVTSPLQMNGGTITDLAGTGLSPLTFSVPVTTGVLVNHPSLSMDFLADDYILGGTHYNSLSSFLSAAGGSFSRASPATYYDATGSLQPAFANAPRFSYNPTTLSPLGLLIEEQRTNELLDSTFSSISSGGPYTVTQNYTGWLLTAGINNSVTITKGSSNNIPYVEIRRVITNSAGITVFPGFHTGTTFLPVTNGDRTVLSAWFGVTAYSSTGGTCTIAMANRSSTSGAAYIAERNVSFTGTTPYQLRRTAVLAHGATAAYADAFFFLSVPTGVTCDITIRVGAPQLERGSTPTSYIPTNGMAATRAHDTLTIPTGAWYNPAEGTIAASAQIPHVGNSTKYPGIMSLDDGTENNAIHMVLDDPGGDNLSQSIFVGNSSVFSYSGPVYSPGSTARQAIGYKLNSSIAAANGSLGTLDTSVTIPNVSLLRIGARRGAVDGLNGGIESFRYYPLRVQDAQVRLLTQ